MKKEILEYLETFRPVDTPRIIRLIGFNVLALLIGFIWWLMSVILYAAHPEELSYLSNSWMNTVLSIIGAYIFVLLIDLTAGVGRVGPLFKEN